MDSSHQLHSPRRKTVLPMPLTLMHTILDGTLADGTSRGDGSADIFKRFGWRWGRTISCWYLPHSRDRRAKTATIEATRQALQDAEFEVVVEIDDTMPTTADLETSKATRQDARVAALAATSNRKTVLAAAAQAASEAASRQLPPGGEPIKVGHHSEGRHRRALGKAHAALSKSVQADQDAADAQRRLQAAQTTTASRYTPQRVAQRIADIEADIRRTNRELDGYTSNPGSPYAWIHRAATGPHRDSLETQLAEQKEQVTYWQTIRTTQLADGTATDYKTVGIRPGDRVKICDRWRTVVRANKTTVTVEDGWGGISRAPYANITAHQPS